MHSRNLPQQQHTLLMQMRIMRCKGEESHWVL
jgi:hypothetical protein